MESRLIVVACMSVRNFLYMGIFILAVPDFFLVIKFAHRTHLDSSPGVVQNEFTLLSFSCTLSLDRGNEFKWDGKCPEFESDQDLFFFKQKILFQMNLWS